MNFPHGHRIAPDLSVLLAQSSATQAASPTARAQTRLDMPMTASGDGHVALFADSGETHTAPVASFAAIFNVRQ